MKPGVQENQFSRNTARGLRSTGLFARSPLIGLTLFLIGSLVFGSLAYQLNSSEALNQWDMTVAKSFRAMQVNTPWMYMENLLMGCFVGKEAAVLIGTILAVYFVHKRFWRELAMVLLGLAGGAVIWYVLSRYFDRPRPEDHLDVLLLSGPSFPSASALMAVLCYGLLAYLLIPNLPTLFWKWFAALISVLAVGLDAVSSLLFGTHYASDVIAGLALGLAWAGVAYTLAERIVPGRAAAESDNVQKGISMQGLRAPGFFRRRPVLSLVLILLGSAVFAGMAYNLLAEGPLLQWDTSVYKQLLAQARAASPVVNDIMLFGFFVGKQAVEMSVAILSIYFLSQRYWREFAMIQISAQGGGLLWNTLIGYFGRPRPPEQMGLVIDSIPSFPSGHALGTVICYGFLAYLIIPKMPSRFWKWTLGIAMLALVLFEGFSRIYQGNHYLTDVIAGYSLGVALTVLVCAAIEIIFMRD